MSPTQDGLEVINDMIEKRLEVINDMIEKWNALRVAIRELDEAAHPTLYDRFGRAWKWKSVDLWTHDHTLAYPFDMIDDLGLPPEKLRSNPNYWQLCDICRSQWIDNRPVSPRIQLDSGRWYDVRDGGYYDEDV